MKKSITIYSLLLLLLFSFTTTSAKEPNKSEYSKIENNLLEGIASENQGLKLSAAYFLGEIKSDKAIIPLMEIFHNSEASSARQVAALALYKINSTRGMFAIKQAIKFDDNDQTKRICTILYNQHLVREQEGNVKVEPIYVAQSDLTYGEYKLSDFAQ